MFSTQRGDNSLSPESKSFSPFECKGALSTWPMWPLYVGPVCALFLASLFVCKGSLFVAYVFHMFGFAYAVLFDFS